MKKLLSVIVAVALCAVMVLGTALAADTVLLEGTNGEVTDAINNAPEGAKIVVTVKYTAEGGTAGAGWGIGGIVTDGSWNVGADFQSTTTAEPAVGDVLTFTFDADAVKNAATGAIQVNYYNGFQVVKAVLRTSDGAAKTADTTMVVLFGAVAVVALVAVVATKKARA